MVLSALLQWIVSRNGPALHGDDSQGTVPVFLSVNDELVFDLCYGMKGSQCLVCHCDQVSPSTCK